MVKALLNLGFTFNNGERFLTLFYRKPFLQGCRGHLIKTEKMFGKLAEPD